MGDESHHYLLQKKNEQQNQQHQQTIKMNTIQKTRSYERFVPGETQRIIRPQHVKSLKKSMKSYGFLESKPITVYTDGVLFHIIDGHHRFGAAKDLGIPIVYLEVRESEKESLMIQGELVHKWKFTDFCRAWADRGKQHYIDLMAYSDVIPPRIAATLLAGGASNVTEKIKAGTFLIKDTHVIDTLMDIIDSVGPINKVVASRAFIGCFAKFMLVQEFSAGQLKTRILANPLSLVKASNEDQMMDQLEEIYNFKSIKKIPLAHLAREASAARNAVKPKR